MDIEDSLQSLPAGGSLPSDENSTPQVAYKRVSGSKNAAGRLQQEKAAASVPGCGLIYMKTQGCAHNQSDSEYMAGLLSSYGYNITHEWTDNVDLFLFNSCTVKGPSQDTFINGVEKARSQGKPVVVAGCVPQGAPSTKQLNGLSIVGTQQIHRVVEVVEETLKGNAVKLLGHRQRPSLDLPKVRKNPFIEIVPISTGCLNHCSYCKTKHARGDLGSYEPHAIINRVKSVTSKEGVTEVWLSSEDTGAYGRDIGSSLPELLRGIVEVLPAGVMLRVGMTNPPYILEHLQDVCKILRHPQVYAFLHVPVQAGSNAVLDAMRREYTVEDFETVVDTLYSNVPGCTVSTDIIVGFPTENDEDFQGTMQVVEKYKFPICNISKFYPRPGTLAAKMKPLDSKTIMGRSRHLSSVFNGYKDSFKHLLGTEQIIFVNGEVSADKKHCVGHNKNYVQVLVPLEEWYNGRCLRVEVTDYSRWSVKAKVLEVYPAGTAPGHDDSQSVRLVSNNKQQDATIADRQEAGSFAQTFETDEEADEEECGSCSASCSNGNGDNCCGDSSACCSQKGPSPESVACSGDSTAVDKQPKRGPTPKKAADQHRNLPEYAALVVLSVAVLAYSPKHFPLVLVYAIFRWMYNFWCNATPQNN